MIATILSLNGGLLTTILCIHNQYLVTINSQIKLSVCLSTKLNKLTRPLNTPVQLSNISNPTRI